MHVVVKQYCGVLAYTSTGLVDIFAHWRMNLIWFSGGTCRGFTSDWFWTAENWKSDIQWENWREKWGMEFIQLL